MAAQHAVKYGKVEGGGDPLFEIGVASLKSDVLKASPIA